MPKTSATLNRYTPIGIHANHMNMTKFLSDQDPDYRNVLSELQRFLQLHEQQAKKEPSSVSSISSTSSEFLKGQPHSHHGAQNESSSKERWYQTTVHAKNDTNQPTKLANTFSGSFHSNGGKMISGNEFNSGGGSMSF